MKRAAEKGDKAKPTLVPKLRFPEFRGDALLSVRLGDVTEESRKRNGKPYAVASVMGVTKADGIVPMEARLVAADITRYKIVRTDWFAYNPMRLSIGSIAQWKGDKEILVSPDYVVFKCITGDVTGIHPSYFNQFRQTNAWEDFVAEGGDGSVRVRIYYRDIAKLRLALPSALAEQQKIAECLSTLDEVIAASGQKIDALKAHKKGLMQQLFPMEGETLPRLRFPEFQDAPEWGCDSLSSFLQQVIDYRGKAPPKSGSGIPLITAKNVRPGWLDMSNDEYIEAKQYGAWMTKGIPEPGDILFTTEAPLGNVARFPSDGRFALGQRIITLQTSPKKCLSDFLFQSLLGPAMQTAIDFHSTGSAAKGIKSSVFVTLKMSAPEIEEQKRIATCLSSLDDLIAAQSDQLEALKLHKKGLMQQLFPAPEETRA